MMTRRIILLLLVVLATNIRAQVPEKEQITAPSTAVSGNDFDIERQLDSLDQELLPKKVTGGVIVGGNFSDFIIKQYGGHSINSYLRAGLEFGGFLDFTVTKHFSIQGQVLITVEQNRFQADTIFNDHMWNFGVEVPVYFMGRFGNTTHGWVQFGAGPYTHFTIASNIGEKWENSSPGKSPESQERQEIENKYIDLYKLHGNHFGVAVMVGYEFPFGLQLSASYKISLSDIATFYSNNKGKITEGGEKLVDASLYPQRLSVNVGYRIQRMAYYKALRQQRKVQQLKKQVL